MIALSVLVPTHDRLPILQETLPRLLTSGSLGEDSEVIVVDDHCTDGTGGWLAGLAEQEPRLIVVTSDRGGRAAARNAGIARARGELICCLDDDMWVRPGFLEAHWRAYQQAAGETVVGVGKMTPHPANAPTAANLAFDRRLQHLDESLAEWGDDLPCRYLCTGNVSLPRRLFEDHQAFDEGFEGYSFEDTELGYRLAARGVRFRYVPEAWAEHRTDTSLTVLLRRQTEAGRSAVRFVQQHPAAAPYLEVPFEVPGVESTRRRDGLPKRLAKRLLFSRLGSAGGEALLRASAALGWREGAIRSLSWAGYARYGRAYREAAGVVAATTSLTEETR